MTTPIKKEPIEGYVCKWFDGRRFHSVFVDTLEDAYSLYVSEAKYVDGSDFSCIKQTVIIFG